MAFQFNNSDRDILISIAEHRVLTARHLSILLGRNANALRRRLKILRTEGLIEIASRPFGRNRGRPESLISLGGAGVGLLQTCGVIDPGVPKERVTAVNIRCLDHELLVNDFRVQLAQLSRIDTAWTIRFFSVMTPPIRGDSKDRALLQETIDSDVGSLGDTDFVPDGVIGITHAEMGRTLLFFLEADRGTEPRNSTRADRRGIRQKIISYQTYFTLKQYKQYEDVLQCELRGFRLLILTEDPTRFSALCRLVRATPPSDFVWLADRASLISEGLWAAIWVQGGKTTENTRSILGSKMPDPCPKLAPVG